MPRQIRLQGTVDTCINLLAIPVVISKHRLKQAASPFTAQTDLRCPNIHCKFCWVVANIMSANRTGALVTTDFDQRRKELCRNLLDGLKSHLLPKLICSSSILSITKIISFVAAFGYKELPRIQTKESKQSKVSSPLTAEHIKQSFCNVETRDYTLDNLILVFMNMCSIGITCRGYIHGTLSSSLYHKSCLLGQSKYDSL